MTLYIVDTDVLTLLRRGHPEVVRRVQAVVSPDSLATTIITAEEQLTGWYTAIRKARRPAEIEHAYTRLADVIRFFTGIRIMTYGVAAIARYKQLLSLKLNVSKNDLRIAAISLECSGTVVSRNVRDFSRVPGLAVEDWTHPPATAPATGP
jgi:tRNA(fMet)-specific endonuclease VapC